MKDLTRNMKRSTAMVLLCICAAGIAIADPPRGGGGGDKHGAGEKARDGKADGRHDDRWGEKFRAQMEKDWEEAQAHFREHSPRRAEAFDKMSEEQQNFFKPLIVARHRGIKWLSRDPELLRNKERQIKLEDDIFSYKQQLAGVVDGSEVSERLKAELRKSVEELVNARMAERELRIDRLEMMITEEKEKLKDDQLKRQQLVDKRMADILAAEVPVIDAPPGPPQGSPPGDRRRAPDGERRDNR